MAEALRWAGMTEVAYDRWRIEYGGLLRTLGPLRSASSTLRKRKRRPVLSAHQAAQIVFESVCGAARFRVPRSGAETPRAAGNRRIRARSERARWIGVRSSSQGPMICAPIGRPSGERPIGSAVAGRPGSVARLGPEQVVEIGMRRAVDHQYARILIGQMIVRESRGRRHRADHRVELAEQRPPAGAQAIALAVVREPFAERHRRAAQPVRAQAFVVGGQARAAPSRIFAYSASGQREAKVASRRRL